MGIEYLQGVITAEQFVVPEEMHGREIAELQPGEWCFVPARCMWMDKAGYLWLDAKSPLETDVEEFARDEYPRVIKLPLGYVVDISHARSFYDPRDTGEVRFVPQDFPDYAGEGYVYEGAPVIGLITLPAEVELFQELIGKQYGYTYPPISQVQKDM